jgi:hypothetical protein
MQERMHVAEWRRSPACGGSDSGCVELAILDGEVLLRDSKAPHGPVLSFTRREWLAFVAAVHEDPYLAHHRSAPREVATSVQLPDTKGS